jgi:hypothetical protein
VVLEGTLGRANQPRGSNLSHEVVSGYEAASQAVISKLSENEFNQLKSRTDQVLSVIKPENKQAFMQFLSIGASHGPEVGSTYLRALLKMPADKILSCMAKTVQLQKSGGLNAPKINKDVYSVAGCEMLNPTPPCGPSKMFGGLLDIDLTVCTVEMACLCSAIPVFNSAKYQIKSPILYLNGELDPNTPPWQTRYHFEHQKGSNKHITWFKNGGHGEFFSGKQGAACNEAIWASAFRDETKDFSKVSVCQSVRANSAGGTSTAR